MDDKLRTQSAWGSAMFFSTYQCRALKRHKCHFCLAFCAVFIVVLATLVVTSIVEKGPGILVKLAESRVGDADASIAPTSDPAEKILPYSYLNYTAATIRLQDKYNHSPRRACAGATVVKKSANSDN